MHTTTSRDGWLFIHHGDFSGDVTLRRIVDDKIALDGEGRPIDVEVPSEVLLDFAAAVLRSRGIERLERATTEELLGLPKRR